MMDVGRSQRRDNPRRTQYKKPPARDLVKPSMNSWEMEFCKVVGGMDWDVFLRKKRNIHFYPKALDWDDLAGKEAFHNAKRRFRLQKYGVGCNIPLPDPNLYINKIDWDSQIDIDLCRDLDSIYNTDEDYECPEISGDPFAPETYRAIAPTGWGDDTPTPTFTARYGDIFGS